MRRYAPTVSAITGISVRHGRNAHEGRYLLRTNLTDSDPALLWRYYIQLTQVEEAFKNLKGDLSIRPIIAGSRPPTAAG